MALLVDPQGAHFWVYTSEGEEGAGDYAPGFHWNELHASDPAAVLPFYQATLGMGHDTMGVGEEPYHLLVGTSGPTCGITRQQHAGAPPMWLAWIGVDDADAALGRATVHGGEVLMPAFDVPGIGRMGIIRDNQGAVVGLITPAPRDVA